MCVLGDIIVGVDGLDYVVLWMERFNVWVFEWMFLGIKCYFFNEWFCFEFEIYYNLGFGLVFYVVEGDIDGLE